MFKEENKVECNKNVRKWYKKQNRNHSCNDSIQYNVYHTDSDKWNCIKPLFQI